MKLIGKGSFTKCYDLGNGTVYLDTVDQIKEVMALGWFPDSKLFPEIKLAEDGEGYVQPLYRKVSAPKRKLKEGDYKLYKTLRDVYLNFSRSSINKYDSYSDWYKAFSECSELADDVACLLLEALDACSNTGYDISFEISPRNIALDDEGNMILLDCFYNISQLEKVRGKK